MNRATLLGCAVVASALTNSILQADVVVTDSSFAFEYVALSEGLQLYEESLDGYTGFASSFTGGESAWAWELTSENGVEASDSTIMAGAGDTSLELNFESDLVYGIGGEFQLLSSEGNPINGLIKLVLSDGTSYISTVSRGQSFAGFVSDDVNITSLNIIGFGEYAPDIAALSSFTIAVVPAPSTMAVLLLLGGTRRSRRR